MGKATVKKRKKRAPLMERYSLRRKAEFLSMNATDPKDHQRARKEVEKMGLDPDRFVHGRGDTGAHVKKKLA